MTTSTPSKHKGQSPSRRSARLQALKLSQEHDAAAKITMAKQKRERQPVKAKARRRQKPKQPRIGFLDLPGEVRTMIYRFALVKKPSQWIRITPSGPSEPSILRLCKTIRKEARSMYYRQNTFDLLVKQMDGAPLVPFLAQMESAGASVECVEFTMRSRPKWENLVNWIEACHAQLRWPILRINKCVHLMTRKEWVFNSAFGLAATVRMLPWQHIANALDYLAEALEGTNAVGWINVM